MDQSLPPSAGPIAGKYELVGLIGRGGMGSVWEGRHTSLGTRVAIKFIESDYADSQEARTRFDNEARAAAKIQSKHAIQIFDHGVTSDGKPYIVMEFLAGEPLDKRIERLGRLSLQDTARIINQVCRGLARAHELGIIHRDLKPENIFLVKTPDDDDEIAKVLDFGIAKIKPSGSGGSGSGGVSSSTKTGAVLGTPFYMSPEQARGLRTVDHRTDLWSIGVITYKCVTGVLPFEGESVGDLLVKICTAPLPVPSHAFPGLPPSFDAWFMRALERDTERRFASAGELSDALAYSAGISVRRAMVSTPEPRLAAGYMPTAQMPAGAISSPAMTPAGHGGGHSGIGGRPPETAHSPYGPPGMSGAGGPSATSAPFTTAAHAAHATGSRGRGAMIGALVVMAALLGVGAFVGVRMVTDKGHRASRGEGAETHASGATTKPEPATSALAAAVTNAGSTAALSPAADAGAHEIARDPATVPTAAPAHPGHGGRPGAGGARPLPSPGGANGHPAVTGGAAPPPQPTVVTPPPPSPPPTTPKPVVNPNDPGY